MNALVRASFFRNPTEFYHGYLLLNESVLGLIIWPCRFLLYFFVPWSHFIKMDIPRDFFVLCWYSWQSIGIQIVYVIGNSLTHQLLSSGVFLEEDAWNMRFQVLYCTLTILFIYANFGFDLYFLFVDIRQLLNALLQWIGKVLCVFACIEFVDCLFSLSEVILGRIDPNRRNNIKLFATL